MLLRATASGTCCRIPPYTQPVCRISTFPRRHVVSRTSCRAAAAADSGSGPRGLAPSDLRLWRPPTETTAGIKAVTAMVTQIKATGWRRGQAHCGGPSAPCKARGVKAGSKGRGTRTAADGQPHRAMRVRRRRGAFARLAAYRDLP